MAKRKKKKTKKFDFEPAFDVKSLILDIGGKIGDFQHVDLERIFCFRSTGSTSKAIARIWSLPRIWQRALGIEAHYIIEVVSRRFDKLSQQQKEKVLIHELMHVPKTFSGSLVPHKCFKKKIDKKSVESLFKEYKKNTKKGGNHHG